MENKIFLVSYRDDRGTARKKWIIYTSKDAHLLWYRNPLHDMRAESLQLSSILRMEEREFTDLSVFMKEKGIQGRELRNLGFQFEVKT